MFSWGLSVLLAGVLMLMSVALITLFERKVLALSQFRVGPNKVLLKGVLQPVLDGVKLFHKSIFVPFQALVGAWAGGPLIILVGMILVWSCFSSLPFHGGLWVSVFLFLLTLSLGVYGVFLSGLSSASKYGLLGGVRACVQSVSYEVSFALIILSIVVLESHSSWGHWGALLFSLALPAWVFSVTAETNRAPFDFAEGESELISGLNLELGSVFFALVFVGEYGMVICFAWFTSLLLSGGAGSLSVVWVFLSLFLRSVFPRLRYDKLLSFCWICILPSVIFWLFLGLSGGLACVFFSVFTWSALVYSL